MKTGMRIALAAAALSLFPTMALADLLFGAKTDFPVGSGPYTVSVGDVNADGKPDLVTANQIGDNVSVALGNGDGTFGTKTDFAVGGHPLFVALGDLNGDGKLDLVTANSTHNSVSVLLGNGNGTFGSRADFGVGAYPFGVAIGDLNGDGKPDLAVANTNSYTVGVLMGTGTGSFGAQATYYVGEYPTAVTIGDLNGDGRPDLAAALQSISYNSVAVLLNNGGGGFGSTTLFPTGLQPCAVAICDLNTDGKPDLVTANVTAGSASVLIGYGNGTFATKTDYTTGASPSRLAVGDLDRDGKLDVAVANMGSNSVSILTGTGTGTFGGRWDFAVGAGPFSVATADVNADGGLDLIAGNYNDNTVSVLLKQLTATSVTLSSSQNPCVAGTTLTFTATVSPSSATGTVTLLAGTSPLGSATLSGGVATFTLGSLSSGTWPLYARYEGNETHGSSTSSPVLSQVVTPPTSTVGIGPSPGMITLTNPVRTVPVTISRTGVAPLMAFSVVFSLSSPLAVNGGPAGIHQGTYLSTANPSTTFNVLDLGTDGLGNHSYQADGTTLGSPYGSTAPTGTLFTIDLSSAAAGGAGTVTITSLTLRDWANYNLVGVIGTSSGASIDQSAPVIHLLNPNGGETLRVGSVVAITTTMSDPEGVAVYYLQYSVDGGATYPNGIASLPPGQTTYAWTVPGAMGSTVRVRTTAIDVNGNTASDASDANFTIAYCTLSYTAGAGGTIAGSATQYLVYDGSGSQVTATPNNGYHFVSWSDGLLTPSRTDIHVAGDISFIATFAANPPVAAPTHLYASRKLTGNPAGSTIGIHLTWDATPNTVEVWRSGFGHYPQFDDAGGSAPATPAAYPPGAGWELTGVTVSGDTDLPTSRDFYYYAAYQRDSYGTWSAAAMTNGTLNYHLGDVSNGLVIGTGDNLVSMADVSAIGAHYGAAGATLSGFAYLDVGPTSTNHVDGRPLTDNFVGFEDLVLFAINYGAVSAPAMADLPARTGASPVSDALILDAPDASEPGTSVTARLYLRGSGDLVALSAKLAWNPAVVEPIGYAAGEWLTRQHGVALSAAPGTVDAAVMQAQGMTGEGELATVTFRVLSAGDPAIRVLSTDGRGLDNGRVTVENSLSPRTPKATRLADARPNPFNRSTTVTFSLARSGPVEVQLYSVDGRKVRMLAHDVRGPGEYSLVWDGRDDNGNALTSGVYFVHLTTAQGRFTRSITYLK